MGGNLLIAVAATILLQTPRSSTTDQPQPNLQRSDTLRDDDPAPGFAFERFADLVQYNRVQGLSLGAGYRLPLSRLHATSLYGTLRYGLSDERVTGRLSLVFEGDPGGLIISGYHDVADIDPFSAGRNLTNSVNALFVAHDNADYMLAEGGSILLLRPVGSGLEVSLSGRVERQSSVSRLAQSEVNDFLGGDGSFPVNPGVREGTFALLSAGVSGIRSYRWSLTTDLLAGEGRATARLFGQIRRSFGRHRGLTLSGKAGAGTRPGSPQALFRLGGVNTVRGFSYGTIRSPAFWAAQLDFAPLGGRVRPVLFLDAGQGAEISGLFSSTVLVGGGVGLSLFSGLVRLDFSQAISPDTGGKVRFDLVVRGVR
jgi:hypothetical protein